MNETFSTGAGSADPANAHHLAELDARYDTHVAALRERAAEARAALERAAETLAETAGGSPPHR